MMKKKYWIKYKMNFGWNDFKGPFDWTFTNRYKSRKAMNDAIKDMKRKGHKIIELSEGY